jgi:hypothetical protein
MLFTPEFKIFGVLLKLLKLLDILVMLFSPGLLKLFAICDMLLIGIFTGVFKL